jgi:uncharacterized protein (DUF427 family)
MSNPSPGFARNPSKVLTIEPYAGEVTVKAGGHTIARSSRALVLSEPPYPAIYYIPFADIDVARLAPTNHSTNCPYKGDASYWSLPVLGADGENAMWAYRDPYDESLAIKDHGAFYAGKVTVEAR